MSKCIYLEHLWCNYFITTYKVPEHSSVKFMEAKNIAEYFFFFNNMTSWPFLTN